MSATQSRSGASRRKTRPTRSGAGIAAGSWRVVRTKRRRWTPTSPVPRISRATRLRPHAIPVARSSAWTLGAP